MSDDQVWPCRFSYLHMNAAIVVRYAIKLKIKVLYFKAQNYLPNNTYQTDNQHMVTKLAVN